VGALCALAPTMELLLVGRVVQGGPGLLAGLGYAVINAALPDRLWTRASAVVSAMWGRHAGRADHRWSVRPIRFMAGGFGALAILRWR
jgi:MFS family permease